MAPIVKAPGFYSPARLGLDHWRIPHFRGVWVGRCPNSNQLERVKVYDGGIPGQALAHAHKDPADPFYGTICIKHPGNVLRTDGQPTIMLRHEITHLGLPHSAGHGPQFLAALRAQGLAAEARRVERLYGRRDQDWLGEQMTELAAAGLLYFEPPEASK